MRPHQDLCNNCSKKNTRRKKQSKVLQRLEWLLVGGGVVIYAGVGRRAGGVADVGRRIEGGVVAGVGRRRRVQQEVCGRRLEAGVDPRVIGRGLCNFQITLLILIIITFNSGLPHPLVLITTWLRAVRTSPSGQP